MKLMHLRTIDDRYLTINLDAIIAIENTGHVTRIWTLNAPFDVAGSFEDVCGQIEREVSDPPKPASKAKK